MPKTTRDVPPPLELLCLRALWSLEQGNVKDVQQIVAHTRPLAYTTIMTVLDRLEKRGGVSRRKQGRSFLYVPKLGRDDLRRLAVKELIDRFFDGSQEALERYLQARRQAAEVRASLV